MSLLFRRFVRRLLGSRWFRWRNRLCQVSFPSGIVEINALSFLFQAVQPDYSLDVNRSAISFDGEILKLFVPAIAGLHSSRHVDALYQPTFHLVQDFATGRRRSRQKIVD